MKKVNSKVDSKKDFSKIRPLGDRVLIKPFSNDDIKTSSGIIIPETVSKERPERGEVIAVGTGKRDDAGKIIPISVNVGDNVMFSKYSYDEIKIDGIEYLIVKEDSILAII